VLAAALIVLGAVGKAATERIFTIAVEAVERAKSAEASSTRFTAFLPAAFLSGFFSRAYPTDGRGTQDIYTEVCAQNTEVCTRDYPVLGALIKRLDWIDT
jgi:hypothetical protein